MTSTARRWLGPWLTPLREWRAFRRRRARVAVSVAIAGGHIDTLTVTPDGVVSAAGRAEDLAAFEAAVSLRLDGATRRPTHVFRVASPGHEGTSPGAGGGLRGLVAPGFRGAVAEWVLEPHAAARTAELVVGGRSAASIAVQPLIAVPYGHLHTHPHVAGRDEIYGVGPPSRIVSGEVLALARQLPAPVLDFGCGAGALVAALRREGVEAYGLELDTARIRQHLLDEAAPFVTFYDGRFPAPFPDGRFASVACSEVLEHIPGPEAAVAEMARLASTTLLVTVPDMSGIPRGFPHSVVPWHLLESSHVNFFTQHSLRAMLEPVSGSVEMSRLGLVECDRMHFFTSVAARAERLQQRP